MKRLIQYTQNELNEILTEHDLYLRTDGKEGQRADLSNAYLSGVDLRDANLCNANLSEADLSEANLCDANLRYATLRHTNLSRANLRYVDLSGADLTIADLSGADLDYSCLPLWCGSFCADFDDRQIAQFAYHIVRAGLTSKNVSDKTKNELKKIISLANTFHRATECGKINED